MDTGRSEKRDNQLARWRAEGEAMIAGLASIGIVDAGVRAASWY